MTRILTNAEIEEHFSMADAVAGLETMFAEMGRGNAISGAREDVLTPVEPAGHDTDAPVYHLLKTMGGSIRGLGVTAVRIQSNLLTWIDRESGTVKDKLPNPEGRYTGLVLLFDTQTQDPLMIFPDGVMQSYRVAGTNAIGAKYLAGEEAPVLGMIGSGWQARAHLRALEEVRDIETCRVYSTTREHREAYAREMDDIVDAEVVAVDSARAAVEGADILQCATSAMEPVFEMSWVEPGTYIGSVRELELPDEYWELSRFEAFVNAWSTITQVEELGGVQITERELPARHLNYYVVGGHDRYPDLRDRKTSAEPPVDWAAVPSLAEVVAGEVPGRRTAEGLTTMVNQPPGAQFAAVGSKLYEVAEREDLGTVLPTELFTQDVQGV